MAPAASFDGLTAAPSRDSRLQQRVSGVIDLCFDVVLAACWALHRDASWPWVVAAGVSFWWASALVKVTDDMIDGDNSIGQLAKTVPEWRRVCLTAITTACAVLAVVATARLSVFASILMLSQAAGCLVAGKIDCWQHAASMGAIVLSAACISGALQDHWWAWLPLTAAAIADELLHDWVEGLRAPELCENPRRRCAARSLAWAVAQKLLGGRVVSDLVAVGLALAGGFGPEVFVLYFAGYEAAETWYPRVLQLLGQQLPGEESLDAVSAGTSTASTDGSRTEGVKARPGIP